MPRTEVEVEVTGASALGVRVVVSPLLTLATALLDALGERPATPWRRLLHGRARGLERGPLAMFAQPAFGLPNGLLPLPSARSAGLHDELEAIRAQPVDLLLRDIDDVWPRGVPAELAPFVADPHAALARYTNALEAHWDRMLRPDWPRVRRLLEREILLAGHTIACDGVDGMLRELHPGVAYEDGYLRFSTGHTTRRRYVARDAMTLAPVACEPDLFLVNEDHPQATVLTYPARGTWELWADARPVPADELAALLGRTRATVALALATPATTCGVAERLGLAQSTASRHLTGLRESGLVDRTRRGPLVYYRLTHRGAALLDLF